MQYTDRQKRLMFSGLSVWSETLMQEIASARKTQRSLKTSDKEKELAKKIEENYYKLYEELDEIKDMLQLELEKSSITKQGITIK